MLQFLSIIVYLQALGYGDKELTKVKNAFKDTDASVDEIIKKGLQLLVK